MPMAIFVLLIAAVVAVWLALPSQIDVALLAVNAVAVVAVAWATLSDRSGAPRGL
jgi:hypothetical protein